MYVITLNVFFWGPLSSYRQERFCDKFPSTLFSRSNWPRQDLISIDVLITFSNKRLNFHRLCILCIAAGQDMNIYYTTLPLTLYVTHYLVPCGPGQDLAFFMYHFQIYSQLVSYNYILSRVCFSRIWWGHGCNLGNIKMIVCNVQFGPDQTLWSKCVIFPLNIQL